ncbi:hypothetical protein QFC22_002711 [Naganishia vaughanmartiniae]|uniref:Uncharacterized protein n=1 Tax=Naganishia vaughanmartiniae TaxID=1424756 RepID=A0ACC2XAG0_9TREE|nr:hypothetical protein QFC22_002711 [Naganishia vaughanmartiniae]
MSTFGTTPRINHSKLGKYSGETVRLTAEIKRMDGDTAVVIASDGGEILIHLHREANLATKYCEIIGRVNEDLTVKVLWCMNLGDNLDLSIVDKVVELAHSEKGQGILA